MRSVRPSISAKPASAAVAAGHRASAVALDGPEPATMLGPMYVVNDFERRSSFLIHRTRAGHQGPEGAGRRDGLLILWAHWQCIMHRDTVRRSDETTQFSRQVDCL